jgi:hypothetical protein
MIAFMPAASKGCVVQQPSSRHPRSLQFLTVLKRENLCKINQYTQLSDVALCVDLDVLPNGRETQLPILVEYVTILSNTKFGKMCQVLFINCRSEFTRIPRYSYCDRDYSYLPQEEVARLNHRQVYESYFREKQSERLWREKERKLTTNSNLDDDPAMQVEYTSHTNGLERTNCDGESRLIKELNSNNTLEYCENSFFDNINDFKKAIPPDKLSLIVVEPSTLKFGNIVVNSTVLKEICMRNFTCNSVGIKLEINCPQLQCSAHPLKRTSGLILSPRSYTKVQFSLRPTEAGFIEGQVTARVHIFPAITLWSEPFCSLV